MLAFFTNLNLLSTIFLATIIAFLFILLRLLIEFWRHDGLFSVALFDDGRRTLDGLETVMELHQRRRSCIMCAIFKIHAEAPLEESKTKAALRRVADKHPMLKARFKRLPNERDFPFEFETMSDFEPDLTFVDTDDWNAVTRTESVTSFDSFSGPLWRVRVVKGRWVDEKFEQHIVAVFNHAIADGTAYMIFGDDLMEELSRPVLERDIDGGDNTDSNRPSTVSLPPSKASVFAKYFLEFPIWIRFIIFLICEKWGRIPDRKHPRGAFLSQTKPQEALTETSIETRTKTIRFEIDEGHTRQLRQACHAHDVKLNAAFMAAVHEALARTFDQYRDVDAVTSGSAEIKSMFAMNLRPRFPPDMNRRVVGSYYADSLVGLEEKGPSEYSQESDSFWRKARFFHDRVHAVADAPNPIPAIGQGFEYIYRLFPTIWRRQVGAPKENLKVDDVVFDFLLSNYGAFLSGEKRRYDIESVFMAGNARFLPIHCSHHIIGVRGKICWTLAFADNVMESQRADALLKHLLDVFEEVEGQTAT